MESETIANGTLVSINRKQKGNPLESGIVSVTKNARIEIRSQSGELLWDMGILNTKFCTVDIIILGFPLLPGVCWRGERGQNYGLICGEWRGKLCDAA